MSFALFYGASAVLSAVLSAVFATCVCIVRNKRDPGIEMGCLIVFGALGGAALAILFCPWLLAFVFLASIATGIAGTMKWRNSGLICICLFLGLAVHSFPVYLSVTNAISHQNLLEQYRFESMETRVPLPRRSDRPTLPMTDEQKSATSGLETEIGTTLSESPRRAFLLKRLHEDGVDTFIRSAGFGIFRMGRATEENLQAELRPSQDVAQGGPPFLSTITRPEIMSSRKEVPQTFREMHYSGIFDFANVRGFGLIESRKKVAGFREHQFSKVPEAAGVKVRAIELVGLLINDQPVVYISDKLPNMANARTAPKRSLNAFELAGLEQLQQGEDLFIRETKEGTRMLGAVRSVEQCVKCHGGERGDLLGAFSYSLESFAK